VSHSCRHESRADQRDRIPAGRTAHPGVGPDATCIVRAVLGRVRTDWNLHRELSCAAPTPVDLKSQVALVPNLVDVTRAAHGARRRRGAFPGN
jgi:hypothetical protein